MKHEEPWHVTPKIALLWLPIFVVETISCCINQGKEYLCIVLPQDVRYKQHPG